MSIGEQIVKNRCAICHDAGSDVSCLLCNTFHHKKCWEYNDSRCSVYGCVSLHHSFQLEAFQAAYKKGIESPRSKNNQNELSAVLAGCCLTVLFSLLLCPIMSFDYLRKQESSDFVAYRRSIDNSMMPYITRLVSKNISSDLPVFVNEFGQIVILNVENRYADKNYRSKIGYLTTSR